MKKFRVCTSRWVAEVGGFACLVSINSAQRELSKHVRCFSSLYIKVAISCYEHHQETHLQLDSIYEWSFNVGSGGEQTRFRVLITTLLLQGTFFSSCLSHHTPVRLSIMSDSSPNIGYNYRFLFILSSFTAGQTHSVLPIHVMSVPCHPTSVDIGGWSSRRIQDSILLVIAFGIMYHSSV